MSDEQRSFVRWALQRAPGDRPTVAEMLAHPWVTLHSVSSGARGGVGQGDWMHDGLCPLSGFDPPTFNPCPTHTTPKQKQTQRRNSSRNLGASGDGSAAAAAAPGGGGAASAAAPRAPAAAAAAPGAAAA